MRRHLGNLIAFCTSLIFPGLSLLPRPYNFDKGEDEGEGSCLARAKEKIKYFKQRSLKRRDLS